MTSGVQPDESDLARSAKFPALVAGILRSGPGRAIERGALQVGDALPIARKEEASEALVTKPGGAVEKVSGRVRAFQDTDVPGLYRVTCEGRTETHLVHLASEESLVEPMDPAELSRLGVAFAGRREAAGQSAIQKASFDLEGQQKGWRLCLLAALFFVLAETALAGLRSRGVSSTVSSSS